MFEYLQRIVFRKYILEYKKSFYYTDIFYLFLFIYFTDNLFYKIKFFNKNCST